MKNDLRLSKTRPIVKMGVSPEWLQGSRMLALRLCRFKVVPFLLLLLLLLLSTTSEICRVNGDRLIKSDFLLRHHDAHLPSFLNRRLHARGRQSGEKKLAGMLFPQVMRWKRVRAGP